MKTNNKTTKAIETMGAGLLAVAMGVALALTGCSTGGGSSNAASTATWPSATPPPTSQTNTYLGTQSPGLYTVTIDHTDNTFSYQDLSTSGVAVSGTFTTTANGFLALSTGGYALEQLSRAVLLVPQLQTSGGRTVLTSASIIAITAPSCQVIVSRTKFEYLAAANPNFGLSSTDQEATNEQTMMSGLVYASTDTSGANWEFGGEIQYEVRSSVGSAPPEYTPTAEPVSGTCAAGSAGSSVVQAAVLYPSSVPANFAIGPTGYFVEDRYQGDGVAFVGAARPPAPVDLSQLSGATFLGVSQTAGASSSGANPTINAPALVSFSAASAGASIALTGGAFPQNDPTQPPATTYALNLGAQDPLNNGFFPSSSVSVNGGSGIPAYALVSQAGGKYSIFVVYPGAGNDTSFVLFQQ